MTPIQLRDSARLFVAILLGWLYIPHLTLGLVFSSKRSIILSDIKRMKKQIKIELRDSMALLYLLHNNAYYRTLFYHRIGPISSLLISWWRPGDKYFIISSKTVIGDGMLIAHPYATVINAESIGKNFSCINCTTLGDKHGKRPIIGNNVTLGANVTIIGDVHVGNNVVIGAGSVVVKDIPDNCIVAGNPAHVIKLLENE